MAVSKPHNKKAPGSPATKGRRKREKFDKYKPFLDERYGHFLKAKAKRGTTKRRNAKAWVRTTLMPEFMTEFFKDVDSDEAEQVSKKMNEKIYSFYNNKYRDDPNRDLKVEDEGLDGRVNPEYLWARENVEVVNTALDEYKAAEEQVSNDSDNSDDGEDIGAWRHVVCELFKKLPSEEQAKWQQKAAEARNLNAAANEMLKGEAKIKYTQGFFTKISQQFKEAERRAGIHMFALGAVDKDEEGSNTLIINSLFSPAVKGFKDTNEQADAAAGFAEYLRDTFDKVVPGMEPPMAVIPDDVGRPVIPDVTASVTLKHLRTMVRVAVSAFWQFAGGNGPVPWKTISKDLESGNFNWIEESRLPTERLPSGEEARFTDPGGMTGEECHIWLDHFGLRQRGGDPDNLFQFQQAYVSLDHKFPDYTSYASKTKVQHRKNDTFLVRYNGNLDRPQTTKHIKYPKPSWDYLHFKKNEAGGLPHWHGLPARPEHPVDDVISDNETATNVTRFSTLNSAHAFVLDTVKDIIAVVNEHEQHVPIIARDQMWVDEEGKPRDVPAALPQSPPSDDRISSFISRHWVGRTYFGADDKSVPCGTVGAFETWQDFMRSGPLYHPESETFRAGKWGVVWVVRGLLALLLSVGAATGILEASVPAPADYELDRVSTGDFKRIVKWTREWLGLLTTSLDNLKATSHERQLPVGGSSNPTPTEEEEQPGEEPFDPELDLPGDLTNFQAAIDKLSVRKQPGRKSKVDVKYFMSLDADSDDGGEGGKGWPSASEDESDEEDIPAPRQGRGQEVDLLKVPAREPVDFETRQFLFGPKPKVPAMGAFKGTAQELQTEIRDFFAECEQVFESHRAASEEGITRPYLGRMCKQVSQKLEEVDERTRPLVATILRHRGMWLRTESLAHVGLKEYKSFWNQFRVGSQLIVGFESLSKTRKGPAISKIEKEIHKVTAYTWACRTIFEQSAAMAILSLRWANHLKDAWETISIDAPYEELLRLVVAIRDWRDDYLNLISDRKAKRRADFKEFRVGKFVTGVKDCWYRYGNPGGLALPEDAEAMLRDVATFNSFLEVEESDANDNNTSSKEPELPATQSETPPRPPSTSSIASNVIGMSNDHREKEQSNPTGSQTNAKPGSSNTMSSARTRPCPRPKQPQASQESNAVEEQPPTTSRNLTGLSTNSAAQQDASSDVAMHPSPPTDPPTDPPGGLLGPSDAGVEDDGEDQSGENDNVGKGKGGKKGKGKELKRKAPVGRKKASTANDAQNRSEESSETPGSTEGKRPARKRTLTEKAKAGRSH